jgi:hypothetical protein
MHIDGHVELVGKCLSLGLQALVRGCSSFAMKKA